MRTPATLLLAIALVLTVIAPPGSALATDAQSGQLPAPAPAQPAPSSLPAPSALPVDIRVNAGGSAYLDSQGELWLADQAYVPGAWGFTAGESFSSTLAIAGTTDDTLYQSQHSNPGQYRFDVGNGVYEVELRFAEIYCSSIACRQFGVKIENTQFLTNFGPMDVVGFARAVNYTFMVKVTDNQLLIEFLPVAGKQVPIVNAIRVSGGPAGPERNFMRLNAGGYDYTDTQGNLWMADQPYVPGGRGYLGASGNPYQITLPISRTNDQILFQTNRYGMGGYAFDIGNGAYRVDLLFAELYASINSTGARVFDVWAEGSKVFSNLDVFALAGNKYRAITETFPIFVLDGQLTITFTQKTPSNAPIVNAIAVVPLDGTPPGGWANFSPTGWQNTQTPAVSIQVQDDLAGLNVQSGQYAYSTNGGSLFSSWLPASVSGANGVTSTQIMMVAAVPFNQDSATQNQVKFRVSDMGANVGTSGIYTVLVDTLPPASVITSPLPGGFVAGPIVPIRGTASDLGSGVLSVEVSTNGGASWDKASGGASWVYNWSLPGDGVYNIRTRARDNIGLVETPGAGITVTADSVLPVTFIRTPSSGQIITSASYVITGTAFDATSGVQRVELSFDGGANWVIATGSTNWSYDWNPTGAGAYSIRARSVDWAGNMDSPGTTVNVFVDHVAPASTITDPFNGRAIHGPSYTIRGTASDAAPGMGLSFVAVSTDGVNWHVASGLANWTYDWTVPGDGPYTIRSRAYDLAGNVQTPAYSVSILVDSAPPVSAITFPAAGQVLGGAATVLQGTASDGTGSGLQNVEISINGGTWVPAQGGSAWSYPWSPPVTGPYNLRVRATDIAGNVENPGPGTNFYVDATAPSSSIVSPYSGQSVAGPSVQISGVASDAYSDVAGVDVSTDGGETWLPAIVAPDGAWSFSWTVGPDGMYTLRSRATDAAGNVETPGPGVDVQVDSVAPLSLIGFPEDGQTIRAGSMLITGTASDAGSGVRRVEVSVDGGPWRLAEGLSAWTFAWSPIETDGQHTIRSRATDNAGNIESPGAGVSVTIDNGKPVTIITAPADHQVITAPDLLISGSSSDATTGVKRVEMTLRRGLDGFYWDGAAWVAAETWLPTTGPVSAWTYQLNGLPTVGMIIIRARATDNVGNVETPGPIVTISVQRGQRTVLPVIISGYTP